MSNTTSDVSFKLSAEEINVFASILNYPLLFGVSVDMPGRWKSELPARLKAITKKLESKGLIRVDLQGVIYFCKELRQAIDTVCSPEKVLQIIDYSKKREHNTVYYFKKGRAFIKVIRNAEEYTLSYSTKSPTLPFMKCKKRIQDDSTSINLPLNCYYRLHNLMDAFERDEALSLAYSITNDRKKAEILLALIRLPIISVYVYQSRNSLMKRMMDERFVSCSDQLFQVFKDEDNMHYKPTTLEQVQEMVECYF